MPVINRNLLNKLIKEYGSTVDLEAQPEFINALLKESLRNISENINSRPPQGNILRDYSRNHERGYDKEGYDRQYSQHDRSWE